MPSDGVEATLAGDVRRGADGTEHPCLRLDFNFKSGAGFVVVQRELPVDVPENYEFRFDVRGACSRNNLEFKLLDGGRDGEADSSSVWWVNKRAFEFPKHWSRITYKKRHFSFAWGPSGGAPLKRISKIEFAIASSEGGTGSVWFDGLTFKELPALKEYTGTPTAQDERGPVKLEGSEFSPAYQPTDAESSLTVDYGQAREFGGIRIEWASRPITPMAGTYDVLISSDGQDWSRVVAGQGAGAERDWIYLPDCEARFVRLESTQRDAAIGLRPIRSLSLLPLESAKDANTFIATLAKAFDRGLLPRWAYGEQSFWTVLGVPDDTHEALINEEGQIEAVRGAFSIEPFVNTKGRVLSWASGTHTQSLVDRHLPIAVVTRETPGLRLKITATVGGPAKESMLAAMYELTNSGDTPQSGALILAIRPLQVNPPAQFLNMEGGVGAIGELKDDQPPVVRVDARSVIPIGGAGITPRGFIARAGSAGAGLLPLGIGQGISGCTPGTAGRLCGGDFTFAYSLAPGDTATCGWLMPFEGNSLPSWFGTSINETALRGLFDISAKAWRAQLETAKLDLPESVQPIEDTFYAQQAYILINKDGPGFQPGSRSYERSWMRDGSMTSAAMLQLGHTREAKEFVEWYAKNQFPDGKVPCVVDRRGPDPVPENDSHGQLIMAIANYHRYTKDEDFARAQLPHVKKAVEYIQSLRAQRLTPDYSEGSRKTKQEPGKPAVPLLAFRGLVPESISHEGYSAKPMHSYWDDLFVYRGLKDAAYLAGVVGDASLQERWSALAKDFGNDLRDSYALAMRTHGVDYLPGCVELGDFDATSTTVALWPVQAHDLLPKAALNRTFEKYWTFFASRRDNPRSRWDAYTPYELRCVNALVHLGMRERALQCLEWFMKDQYPPGWHHWAEVVWSEPRTTRFIGDMPHTWVGSDFLNSLRSMLVYEDEADESLVLFAGVPLAWTREDGGVSFSGFRTYYGELNASIRTEGNRTTVRISGDASNLPRHGIIVRSPTGKMAAKAMVNGVEARQAAGSGDVQVHEVPAEIVWEQ